MDDLISRQQAIDAVDSETVSTNPEHFKSIEKFIKFMDDADIASFGKWQWANGFNTAVVAAKIQLEKLPSAQPERKDALEKAVAVEAISDELMSRFDISATCAYDVAEAAVNRIEAMAKELERGEQE